MYLAVVTGGIGTGKSTVTKRIDHLGGFTISLDEVYHVLLEEDEDMRAELIDTFGAAIADEDGFIVRPRLAAVALCDEESTRRLEEITHPRIRAALMESIDRAMDTCMPDPSVHMVAVEVPLFERDSEIGAIADEVIVVTSPIEARLTRLMTKGLEPEDIANRLDRQPSDEEWLAMADTVFENDSTIEVLEAMVDSWWSERSIEGWRGRGAR